jgi:integrase
LLDTVVARGSNVMANRLLATLRKLFNWSVSRGIISVAPSAGISAPYRERARDRVLKDDELAAVFNAAKQVGGCYGSIVQMLVLTGQRRGEVSEMTWKELDQERDLWTIPAARAKNGKAHTVHISKLAMQVLSPLPKVGEFVFTSNGKTPFSGFSKSKKRLDELSGVSDWRLHDIRRTVISGMAQLGIAPHVADKILNHQSGTISGVAAVYQRHEFLEERKLALDAWDHHVQSLTDKVVMRNDGIIDSR